MVVSSRTPEGEPGRCPLCGAAFRIEPSDPLGDAPCPSCGQLAWISPEGRPGVVIRLPRQRRPGGRDGPDRGPDRGGSVAHGSSSISPIASEWIDSEALSVLLGLKNRVLSQRGALVLRNLRPDLREVFRFTRLDHVFTIEPP